jgi:fumarate reductase (CoM/CoB) subunit A
MTRDRLAQAIMREILEGRGIEGGLTMDISALRGDKLEKVLSVIKSRRYPEKAIVAPAAHYFMGGIVINRNAETGLRRLFAAGEVCGGIHGANRLAGNAIADILVLGTIAGRQAAQLAEGKPREDPALARAAVNGLREMAARRGGEHLETLRHTLREIMWEKAGIIRNEKSLREALEIVEAGRKQLERIGVDSPVELIRLVKLANMFRVSEMVCRTALLRTESRGSHYRSDFPEENNTEWLKRILISKTDEGMKLSTAPVSLSKLSPPQSSL